MEKTTRDDSAVATKYSDAMRAHAVHMRARQLYDRTLEAYELIATLEALRGGTLDGHRRKQLQGIRTRYKAVVLDMGALLDDLGAASELAGKRADADRASLSSGNGKAPVPTLPAKTSARMRRSRE